MAHAKAGGSPATDERSALRLKIIFAIARCKSNGEAVATRFVENKDTLESILEWVGNLPHGFDELKGEVERAVAATSGETAAATSPPAGVAETAAATSPPAAGVAETAAAAPLSSPENELLLTVLGAISKCKPNGQAVAERFVSNEDSLETVLAWVRGLSGDFDDLKREVESDVAAVPSSSAHSRGPPPPLPEQPAAAADSQRGCSPTAAVVGQSGAQARQGRRLKHKKGAQVSVPAVHFGEKFAKGAHAQGFATGGATWQSARVWGTFIEQTDGGKGLFLWSDRDEVAVPLDAVRWEDQEEDSADSDFTSDGEDGDQEWDDSGRNSNRAPRGPNGSSGKAWTLEEDQTLLSAHNNRGVTDWAAIAVLLPGRTEAAVQQRYWGTLKHSGSGPEAKKEGMQLFSVLAALSKCQPNGAEVAKRFADNKDSLDTVVEWVRALTGSSFDALKVEIESIVPAPSIVRRRPWTAAEDEIILSEYGKEGWSWAGIAARLPGRNLHSAAEHYRTALKSCKRSRPEDEAAGSSAAAETGDVSAPPTKRARDEGTSESSAAGWSSGQPWSTAEGQIILDEYGKPGWSWAAITARLPGRSLEGARAHYYQRLKKRHTAAAC